MASLVATDASSTVILQTDMVPSPQHTAKKQLGKLTSGSGGFESTALLWLSLVIDSSILAAIDGIDGIDGSEGMRK